MRVMRSEHNNNDNPNNNSNGFIQQKKNICKVKM